MAKKAEKTIKPAVQHRSFEGRVVSAPGQKTAYVLVETMKEHPKYRKQYFRSSKYPVHDEENTAKVGDTVTFQECRPMSKNKRWRLVRIHKKNA
ncbi:MAG TPA: 30S ribosomal protein S17 [Candidatus Kapabacteria bacterium]|nr:30S ribosomal protein S17 [Candidatus Kapabacteria bacterium]